MHELRRAHTKWPPRRAAKNATRVSRGVYVCDKCKGKFGPKQIDMDHTVPVIDPVEGFVDLQTYIDRLFLDESGYQVLCKECHKKKTHEEENPIRRENKSL